MLAQEEARRLGHNFVGTEQVSPRPGAPRSSRFPLDRVPLQESEDLGLGQWCLSFHPSVPTNVDEPHR